MDAQTTSLFLIVLFIFAGAVSLVLVRAGRRPTLRPLPGFQSLPGQLSRVIEEGQSLHLHLGSGGIGSSDTITTLAGLAVLEGLAEESAAMDAPPTVTMADPTTLVMAQDVLRRAHDRQGNPKGYDALAVRYVAALPLPYAAGVMDLLSSETTSTSVLAGVFGAEAALIAEEGARQGLVQEAAVADPASMAVLYPTVNDLSIGEEMYAASAYLRGLPAHIASLLAQDFIRLILILFIIAGAAIQLLLILGGTSR